LICGVSPLFPLRCMTKITRVPAEVSARPLDNAGPLLLLAPSGAFGCVFLPRQPPLEIREGSLLQFQRPFIDVKLASLPRGFPYRPPIVIRFFLSFFSAFLDQLSDFEPFFYPVVRPPLVVLIDPLCREVPCPYLFPSFSSFPLCIVRLNLVSVFIPVISRKILSSLPPPPYSNLLLRIRCSLFPFYFLFALTPTSYFPCPRLGCVPLLPFLCAKPLVLPSLLTLLFSSPPLTTANESFRFDPLETCDLFSSSSPPSEPNLYIETSLAHLF